MHKRRFTMADWFYIFDGKEQGPINDDDLHHMFFSGALPNTLTVTRVLSSGQITMPPAPGAKFIVNINVTSGSTILPFAVTVPSNCP